MAGRLSFVVMMFAVVPAAHAWDVVGYVSLRLVSEVSIGPMVKLSSEASSESTRAQNGAERRAEAKPDEPLDPAAPRACSSNDVCDDGQRCVNGSCEFPPEPPPAPQQPPMMLERQKATELYLRAHAAQLKQDVALGDGPIVAALSVTEHLPRAALGRVLRANHRELLKLIGDDCDEEWAGTFLRRVTELSRGSRRT
ncbi:MAG: hypothetical protein JNK82_23750 [Myxococcaceae bacterium]|nr:hypothetical protein [Myxococcaceae bacterium]